MPKQLRFWNGRGAGNKYQGGTFFVAAYSKAQAARMIGEAAGYSWPLNSEIKDYYFEGTWGTRMESLRMKTIYPVVYVMIGFDARKAKLLLSIKPDKK